MAATNVLKSVVLILIFAASTAGCFAQVIKIDIKEVVWTDSITNSCMATHNFADQIPLGQVGLWIKAYCNCHTFKVVQEKGHLPILFKWFKRVGLTWTPQDVLRPNDLLNIHKDSIPDSTMIAQGNSFYWSSWFVRTPDRMSEGIWRVVVVTEKDNKELIEAKIKVKRNGE